MVSKQDDGVTRVMHGTEPGMFMPPRQHRDVRHVTFEVGQHLRRVAHPDRNVDARVALEVVVHHLDHMKRAYSPQFQLATVQLAGVAQQVVCVQIQCRHRLSNRQ